MNKDVIYIDIDDDVTAIIGKIKNAKEKVIALVPPKRAGALQSAVNLRLIDRMAKSDKRHLVLVTTNPALVTLAASANIPVARNLQSKPELAEVPALIVDNGDDIIDGASLPVGDHAASVKVTDATRDSRSDAIDSVDINLDVSDMPGSIPDQALKPTVSDKSPRGKSKSKIPDFNRFRKRLVLGIIGGAGLVALLIWMFVFAPAATVIITAKTTESPVSASVKLGGTAATDFKTGVISSVSQQLKKDVVIEFEATGQKNVGEKAAGTLDVSILTQENYTVPAGTVFTKGSLGFVTNETVIIPASTPCFPSYCAQSTEVAVTAQQGGAGYNGVSGNVTNASGVKGVFQSATTGGTDKVAKVVSADDIEHAKGKLAGESTEADKKTMLKKFVNGEKVVDGSFTVDRGESVVSPAIDTEAADGKAKLTTPTTYTMQAISPSDLDVYLNRYLEAKLSSATVQRVFVTGSETATLSNFRKEGEAMIATLNAIGRIGPKIDEADIKERAKGKIFGDVQDTLQLQPGISNVDVQFSYWWVRTVPGDVNKIKVEYKVENE